MKKLGRANIFDIIKHTLYYIKKLSKANIFIISLLEIL